MSIDALQQIKVISRDDINAQALRILVQTKLNIRCQNLTQINTHSHSGLAGSFVLIDANYPIAASSKATAKLQGRQPDLRAALFNVHAHSQQELLVKWPIVKGLFYQDDSPAILLKGLQQLLNNNHWFPQRVSDKLLNACRQTPPINSAATLLSRRKLHIVDELSKGKTNKMIASSLHISEYTVKSHLYRIFKKMGANNRFEVQAWALENI